MWKFCLSHFSKKKSTLHIFFFYYVHPVVPQLFTATNSMPPTGMNNEQKAATGRGQQPGEPVTQMPPPEEAEEDAFHGRTFGKCPVEI